MLRKKLLVVGALIFTWSATANSENSCESPLLPYALSMYRWAQFRASILPNYAGFELRRRSDSKGLRNVSIYASSKKPFLIADRWNHGEQELTFLETGFRRLENLSREINQIASEHLSTYPEMDLRVNFRPELRDQVAVIADYRWRIHDEVLKLYSEVKGYLDDRDLMLLKYVNVWSANNDVFALLLNGEFNEKEPMTLTEFRERLALTIQITYFGDQDFLRPTTRGIMTLAGLGDYTEGFDLFPFEYRTPEEIRPAIREGLAKRFNLKSACEFARYAKFQNVPFAVHQRFLLKALLRAQERGVKTIFAAGDSHTIRLFRRFGFKFAIQLPVRQNAKPEYLTYLEVDSDPFRQTVEKLRLAAGGLP